MDVSYIKFQPMFIALWSYPWIFMEVGHLLYLHCGESCQWIYSTASVTFRDLVFVVCERNGSLCILDYCGLNKIMMQNQYIIPFIL